MDTESFLVFLWKALRFYHDLTKTGLYRRLVCMRVDQIAARSTEYLNDAGIPSLAGVVFVLLGLSSLIWPVLARNGHPSAALGVQMAGTVLAWLALLAILMLKRRLVFPRAGYAVPRRPPSVRAIKILALGGIVLVGLLAVGRHRIPEISPRFAAPAFSMVFALIAVWAAWRNKSRLGFCFAAYLIGLGAVLWRTQPEALAGMSWLEISIGGPLGIHGAIRLRKFLKANIVEESDEHR